MAKRFVPLFGLFLALGMGILPLRAQTIDSTPLAPPPDLPPPVVMPLETPPVPRLLILPLSPLLEPFE